MSYIISDKIICWTLFQLGLVSMILILQIRSTLPCLVGNLLIATRFKTWDPGFWPDRGFSGMTRDDWSDWSSTAGGNKFEDSVFYLLNCGYCLAFHLSWVSSVLIFSFVTGNLWTFLLSPLVFTVSVVALAKS